MKENLIDFDRYVVTKDGKIWSKYYKKYLDGNIGTEGYLQIWLTCKDGKKRYFMKHRVIAYYFIPNPEEKPTVNHKNHKRDDNTLENLEWATYKEQCDEIQKEKKSKSLKNSEKAKSSSIKNLKIASEINKKLTYQYTLDGKLLNIFESVNDAANSTGALPQNISSCCNGKKKTSKGYRWTHFPL